MIHRSVLPLVSNILSQLAAVRQLKSCNDDERPIAIIVLVKEADRLRLVVERVSSLKSELVVQDYSATMSVGEGAKQ